MEAEQQMSTGEGLGQTGSRMDLLVFEGLDVFLLQLESHSTNLRKKS